MEHIFYRKLSSHPAITHADLKMLAQAKHEGPLCMSCRFHHIAQGAWQCTSAQLGGGFGAAYIVP